MFSTWLVSLGSLGPLAFLLFLYLPTDTSVTSLRRRAWASKCKWPHMLTMQPFVRPEQLLLWVWLHGHGLSFTLKPWDLATVQACLVTRPSDSQHWIQEVAVCAANAFNSSCLCFRSVSRRWYSLTVTLHSHSHGLAEVHITMDSQSLWNIWMHSLKFTVSGRSKQANIHTIWSHTSVGLIPAHYNIKHTMLYSMTVSVFEILSSSWIVVAQSTTESTPAFLSSPHKIEAFLTKSRALRVITTWLSQLNQLYTI